MSEFYTAAEIQELRKTMPWTDMSINTGRHTVIRVIDNRGQEVPLLDLVKFCRTMSFSMAQPQGAVHAA